MWHRSKRKNTLYTNKLIVIPPANKTGGGGGIYIGITVFVQMSCKHKSSLMGDTDETLHSSNI